MRYWMRPSRGAVSGARLLDGLLRLQQLGFGAPQARPKVAHVHAGDDLARRHHVAFADKSSATRPENLVSMLPAHAGA
jgi:hypothetical protein